MSRPSPLSHEALNDWLQDAPGWRRSQGWMACVEPSADSMGATIEPCLDAHGKPRSFGLEKVFPFQNYSQAMAFAVELAMLAERKDHHPELWIGWGKVAIFWSTHDAGGISALDTELAMVTERVFARVSAAGSLADVSGSETVKSTRARADGA